MRVVNLMKHNCVVNTGRQKYDFEPSGLVATVETEHAPIGTVTGHGIEIVDRRFGKVDGLPDPEPGVIYLVSSMVLEAVPHRRDVFAPDSGPTATRNYKGHVIEVARLIGNR